MNGERCRCGKTLYTSEGQAKQAHKRAGFRIRVYWCNLGRGWHATNKDRKGYGRK